LNLSPCWRAGLLLS